MKQISMFEKELWFAFQYGFQRCNTSHKFPSLAAAPQNGRMDLIAMLMPPKKLNFIQVDWSIQSNNTSRV